MQFNFILFWVAPVVHSDRKVDGRIRPPSGAEGGNAMRARATVHTIRGSPWHFGLPLVVDVDHDTKNHH